MKGLGWFDKFLFLLNSLFAAVLLFAYLLPFVPPKTFILLSVFSLGVPLLIIVNVLFLIYWLLRLKRQVMLPLVVLLLGFNHLTSIYEFSSTELPKEDEGTLRVLSYNVRQFNQFRWSERADIPQRIAAYVNDRNPDIVGMQEFYNGELGISESFPYRYVKLKERNAEFGLAILSKYPIINSGSLEFPTLSNNNAIYADIVVGVDTLRVINVHLQSYNIKPRFDNLEQEHSKRVFRGMGQTFVKQQEQMEMVLALAEESPYRNIIIGDFNNTAFSYMYREVVTSGFVDAYKAKGNGFGRTFDFDYFPVRIDYILPDESFEVLYFETGKVRYSDHFPVWAVLKL